MTPRFDRGDLLVLSHLRWTFVWQRPQHLISRLGEGRRTWFVEEPVGAGDISQPRLKVEQHGPVTRVVLEVPGDVPRYDFDHPDVECLGDELFELLGGRRPAVTWLYTPLALPVARRLGGGLQVYDVMDDLGAFAGASPRLRDLQADALEESDLVFTGGRSLHAGVRDLAPGKTFLFASGVEPEHYAPAIGRRSAPARPVAGYVGVIDERIDLELVAAVAALLPDWDLQMVGPVAKIDPEGLPQAPNLRYPGMAEYAELPDVMAGFHVALMPFALNDATRSISPTKTLEYFAAGLPVVSTPVPDVVADHSRTVAIATDATAFADACRAALQITPNGNAERVRQVLHDSHWDTIADRMSALMRSAAEVEEDAWQSPAYSSAATA